MKSNNYLSLLNPFERVSKKILRVNPTIESSRKEPKDSSITIYEYNEETLEIKRTHSIDDCQPSDNPDKVFWINIDGLRKVDVEKISAAFQIHPLITEDILSIGQRPKVDELGNIFFTLLNMLYYNEETTAIEAEQVSLVLGKNFVISFQEDPHRDLFNPVREKLKLKGSKIRNSRADYLFYSLIDMIVDNYFVIMDKLGEKIEALEEEIIQGARTLTLAKISYLRKEMIFLKRSTSPVREVIGSILRSENELINEQTEKYFKDVYDHIVQANELSENYRDMMLNLHDLYLSEVNLRMNEVMKVMAIVTCLLAPATVIGGIFGMNFNRMPWLHNQYGFLIAVGAMLLIPLWMIWMFKKRGWF